MPSQFPLPAEQEIAALSTDCGRQSRTVQGSHAPQEVAEAGCWRRTRLSACGHLGLTLHHAEWVLGELRGSNRGQDSGLCDPHAEHSETCHVRIDPGEDWA
eukprot:8370007-Alexandrium_andersonii.AAC.1